MKWKKAALYLWPIVLFLIINFLSFYPEYMGRTIIRTDSIQGEAKTHARNVYQEKNDEIYIWNPGQFSGMPLLYGVKSDGNFWAKINYFFRMGPGKDAGLFFGFMLFAYIMSLIIGFTPLEGALLSVMVALPLTNIIVWKVGHFAKIQTLLYSSLLIAGVYLLYEKKKYLLGLAVFAVGMAISLGMRHPQMTYYIFMVFGVYGIFKLAQIIREKDYEHLWRATAVLLLGIGLGIGASLTTIWSMKTHADVSMRGKPILKKTSEQASSSEVDGLDWEYAMSWSNGMADVMSTFIPGFSGGSGNEKVSKKSETFNQYNINRAPLYWGELPFTASPMYLGAVVFFLFALGAFYIRGHLKWWLVASLGLVFLCSMGKHAPTFNRLLFDYLPLYNKWRTPQSILSVLVLFLPLLGLFAIHEFSKKKDVERFLKALLWATAVTGGLALFSWMILPGLLDFSAASDQTYSDQGADVSAFIADRKTLLKQDSGRTLLLILAAAGLLWAFAKGYFQKVWLVAGLMLLVIIDFMGVKGRYLTAEDYVQKEDAEEYYKPRPVDQEILSREPVRENYRVQDVTIDWTNNASTSYFHNTIGGYDPVKLQRYQDLIKYHLSQGNRGVFNMLNAKYFILPGQNNEPSVSINSTALGNAWFVDKITTVKSPNDEIEYLTDMDPAVEVVVREKEFGDYVAGFDPIKDSTGVIRLTEYTPDRMVYSSRAKSEQMAVFSEIWFDGKSWKTFIDGEQVPNIRVNYALRGMRVPAGEHEIEFRFEPASVKTGEKVSYLFSFLILGLFFFVSYNSYRLGDVQEYLEMKSDFGLSMKKDKPKVVTTSVKKKKKKSTKKSKK